jgi:hypothetical protein
VQAKNNPTGCDSRVLKAEIKNAPALNSAFAFESQQEFQTAFVARRFGLSPATAGVVAALHFGEGAR